MRINRFYQKLKPYYVKYDPSDTTLIFESRFESGNLRRAVQIGEFEYDLILKYDYGTNNYT
jgi:cytosolic carboxypeptidase protein 2/3